MTQGQSNVVTLEALAGLFELFRGVECVLLNTRYSEAQAEAIAKSVDYVIGMDQEIGDQAAIEFSKAFYDAIGVGESIEFAYKLGCNAIRLIGIPEDLTPILKDGNDYRLVDGDKVGIKKLRRLSFRTESIRDESILEDVETLRNSIDRIRKDRSRGQITISIPDNFDAFTPKQLDDLVAAICAAADIDPDEVFLQNISSGSVRVTIELSQKDAQKFVRELERKHPQLESYSITIEHNFQSIQSQNHIGKKRHTLFSRRAFR